MYIAYIFLASWLCVVTAGTEFNKYNQGIDNLTSHPIPPGTTSFRFHQNLITEFPFGYFAAVATITQIWLQQNQLTVIEKHMFAGLAALQDLRLFQNKLHTIQADTFKENMALSNLQLQSNSLQTLPESMFDPQNQPVALHFFYIYNNPLWCDDSLSWIKQASGHWLLLSNPQYIECAGPETLEGCKWNDLTIHDLETGRNFYCPFSFCSLTGKLIIRGVLRFVTGIYTLRNVTSPFGHFPLGWTILIRTLV